MPGNRKPRKPKPRRPKPPKLLGRDAILAASDLPTETVSVPEWGGAVIVRTMTGRERDAWELAALGAGVSRENIRARLVAATAVNADGKRLFGETDVAALGDKSGAALDRLWDAASRLNGIGAYDVEELAKN